MRHGRFFLGLFSLFVVALASQAAWAKPSVHAEAALTLGATSTVGPGWLTVQVRLENTGAEPLEGSVELVARPAWSRDGERHTTRVPVAIEPKGRALLELPTHGFAGRPHELTVHVYDASDELISRATVSELRQGDPLLVDLSQPSRLAATVRDLGIPLTRQSAGSYQVPTLAVSSPMQDPATGEPLLPRWAAGYSNATVVASTGRRLATLPERELVALTDWVLSGGALAVAIERPEDLRFAGLLAMVGEGVRETPPDPALLEPQVFLVPTDPGLGVAPPSPMPGRAALKREEVAPSFRLVERLHSYKGGNLRPTPWGAAASYGLGEVHLLAFPIDEHAVTDRWVQLKVADLVRHAWDRQGHIALPLGQNALDGHQVSFIRKVLDPNENMRWTIALSALVLLLYAGVAGPLNFYLASRKGRPLRAILWLPVLSLSTLLVIVAIGVVGKGVKGRARKLALVEAGAGMARASATRFRALYAPSAKELSVRPLSRASLLDVASEDELVERRLVVDRDGVRVAGLRAKPWQPLVLREDGPFELGGGVSLVRDGDDVVVKNRTARDLVAVVLKSPDGVFASFPRIPDGASVRFSQGERLSLTPLAVSPNYRPLNMVGLQPTLDLAAPGVTDAWMALASYAGNDIDWWPPGVPVLLGQLEGGEGKKADTGLEIDVDRVLVRVIGFGGVP